MGSDNNSSKVLEKCRTCDVRFSYLNLFVNLALALAKGLIGFLSTSRALLANSLYSLNDVFSAAIVLVSLKIGGRPADDDHVYGHGKVEFISIAIMSFVMIVSLLFIVFYSLFDIIRGVEGPPHMTALFVALLSLIIGETLARMGLCAAQHSNSSPALLSCAEHNRADALSSLAVALGVGGALLGLHILDPIVAIFETFHICLISGEFFSKAIKGLMDSAIPTNEIEGILKVCGKVPGVVRVPILRTRQMGTKSCVDMVVNVSGKISVKEANEVAIKVKSAVRGTLKGDVEAYVRFKADEG